MGQEYCAAGCQLGQTIGRASKGYVAKAVNHQDYHNSRWKDLSQIDYHAGQLPLAKHQEGGFAAVALIFLAFAEMGQLCEESYAEKEKSKTDYPS